MAPRSKNIKYNPIEWAMWANVLGVLAGTLMIIGGIITFFNFQRIGIGIYAIPGGAVVLAFEWPRSKRRKGRTLPRWHQYIVADCVRRVPLMSTNYFFRAIVYVMMATPCFFELPPLFGGTVLAISAIVYFVAALKGEQWTMLPRPSAPRSGPKAKLNKAPDKPPPRLPPGSAPPRLDLGGGRGAGAGAGGVGGDRSAAYAVDTTSFGGGGGAGGSSRPAVQPKPRPAPKPKPAPKPSAVNRFADWPWESARDPASGDIYYINTRTDETTWDKPPLWDEWVAHRNSSSA